MSSIEMNIAPGVSNRRREISGMDNQLHDLNLRFPGERKKPDNQKDPEYQALRSGIIARRQFLSGMQHLDKRKLRGVNR